MSDPMNRLEALSKMVDEVDAANPQAQAQQAQQAQEQAQALQGAAEWAVIPKMVGSFVCMIEPALKDCYSDARCLEWGTYAQAVSDKRGWGTPTAMPEIALLMSSVSFVIPSVLMVRAKVQQAQQDNPKGWVARVGLWWRNWRAKSAKNQPDEQQEAQGNGRQQ